MQKKIKVLPKYLVNYGEKYRALYSLYMEKGVDAFFNKYGLKTPAFREYQESLTEVISYVMKNEENEEKVKSLYDSSEYHKDRKAYKNSVSSSYTSYSKKEKRKNREENYKESYAEYYSENRDDEFDPTYEDYYANCNEDYDEEYNEEYNENYSEECNDDYTKDYVKDYEADQSDSEVYEQDNCYVNKYGIDDVLTHLVDKVLELEIVDKYFISKADAKWAYNSLKFVVHNELCDMVDKLPKPMTLYVEKKPKETTKEKNSKETTTEKKKKAHQKMVALDSYIKDAEGNSTTVGSMTADVRQNTEHEVMVNEMLEYAKTTFLHEVIDAMISKPHYLIAYLNSLTGRKAIELCRSIIVNGFDEALYDVVELLKEQDVYVDYIYDSKIEWKKDIELLVRNSNVVNNWIDEARKIVNDMCIKKDIY